LIEKMVDLPEEVAEVVVVVTSAEVVEEEPEAMVVM